MSVTTEQNVTMKSFSPKLGQDNQQRTWSREGKTYFEFEVVLTKEDGTEDVGTMSSTSTEPTWKVGGKILKYTKSVMTNTHGTFTSFKGVDWDKPAGGYKGGGGGRKPAVDNAIIIRSVAARNAHQFINELGKADDIIDVKLILDIAQYFEKTIISIAKGDNGRAMMIENALYTSIEALQFKNMKLGDLVGIANSTQFRDYAINLYRYIWGGRNEDGSLKPLEEL